MTGAVGTPTQRGASQIMRVPVGQAGTPLLMIQASGHQHPALAQTIWASGHQDLAVARGLARAVTVQSGSAFSGIAEGRRMKITT